VRFEIAPDSQGAVRKSGRFDPKTNCLGITVNHGKIGVNWKLFRLLHKNGGYDYAISKPVIALY
jgi:hypothetical protein